MPYETAPDVVLEIYYLLLLTRAFEERLEKLYRQGQVLGGVFSGIGQECVTVGSTFDLAADDVVLPRSGSSRRCARSWRRPTST